MGQAMASFGSLVTRKEIQLHIHSRKTRNFSQFITAFSAGTLCANVECELKRAAS